ncbi:MAG: rhodanese-like domain-containing protein [Flavobacteriales bacterium]|nr:rhodanese-like domain-containing protein [Flavobacteriales bacterium]MCB0813378.1 rhodanese-like domain-containing protein [Flavobacteriales bacterium]MCB0816301.1 rhodanese-like domain-containing protein [Flavobacteriales bacterium]MCB9181332.1 rhodanese-like domain-containing protein [Flavobacteriales bacterium]MCB9200802.1 rhodanese-like domain-containing protein [Flavobacteriales bacterium]
MSIFGQLFGGGQPATLPEGAILVDVRSPMEYNMGHVQGSINIPLDTVQQELSRFKSMNGPIVLICASGNRSGQATAYLQRQGLENVQNGGSWTSYR